MPHEFFSDFDNVPWCQQLLSSPSYKHVQFTSRCDERADAIDPHLFRLFRRTLATPETIRACLALEKPATPDSPLESLLLVSLGEDLDGHPGMAHGGIVALLMDELLSLPAEAMVGSSIFTLYLNIKYKKPLKIPCVLLGRAWSIRTEGRKIWADGVLEDGNGSVYAEGESLFIKAKQSTIPEPPKL